MFLRVPASPERRFRARRGVSGAAVLLGLLAGAACGRKAPPLAPLPRLAEAPAQVTATRIEDEVLVAFTVPAANQGGRTPADASVLELYGVTASAPPSGTDLTRAAVRVMTVPVYVPPPPVPEPLPDAPPASPLPVPEGFAQGAPGVLRETLTAALRDATVLPDTTPVRVPEPDVEEDDPLRLSPPVAGPSAFGELKRYYFLRATDGGRRRGAASAVVSVPLQPGSGAPVDLEATYTDTTLTLTWGAGVGAWTAPPASTEKVIASTPLVPVQPPTEYFVYAVEESERSTAETPWTLQVPRPLNPTPLATTTFAVPGSVVFGTPRCFAVRGVDTFGTAKVLSPVSSTVCVTPSDTFAPAAPARLAAIGGVGVVSLVWEANIEADLDGYLVLRGLEGAETLTALTREPIQETTFRDTSVTPGVRYDYVVVAVDRATPPNRSEWSARVTEAARVPEE
ncbi:MAG: fibronectin type III domain-containing protein [Acidobacteria bacterium]|nr:fibronectin type III domain-containing protein [Acidobacteriota bacterium]